MACEGFESRVNRRLAGCTAARGMLVAHLAHRLSEHRRVVGIENRLYRKDLRMAAKRLHRPRYHGPARDRSVLLRFSRAGAKPASGGENNGGSPFLIRHRDLRWTTGGIMRRLGRALPLSRPCRENRRFPRSTAD